MKASLGLVLLLLSIGISNTALADVAHNVPDGNPYDTATADIDAFGTDCLQSGNWESCMWGAINSHIDEVTMTLNTIFLQFEQQNCLAYPSEWCLQLYTNATWWGFHREELYEYL